VRARRGRVLALVVAGGEGQRLKPLTDSRAKPALPFAGVYRLIDFPLSNCHHSRVSDVWVIQQFEAHTLSEHIANGRPWDLDRTWGGLRVVHPTTGDESGFYEGNADAINRNRSAIERFDPELLLVLSADGVYKLDYATVLESHVEREAEATLVTTTTSLEEAGRFGTVTVDGEGLVTGFEYKPDRPGSEIVTTEVFVYDAQVLLHTLAELEEQGEALSDFGHSLLPRLVDRGKTWAYDLGGHWQDVGTLESYWQAHMDLLDPEPPLRLDDPEWPILTRGSQRPPARIEKPASVESSLISPGCTVRGNVARSVLGPGVVVDEGVSVVDSIVLGDSYVRADLERAIVDLGVDVAQSAAGADEPIVVSDARSARDRAVTRGS
jgi:glucose-1-phosphate adenylyltransferase